MKSTLLEIGLCFVPFVACFALAGCGPRAGLNEPSAVVQSTRAQGTVTLFNSQAFVHFAP